ncbi:alpha-2-macroglobulin [Desulfosarcina sp. OttesenSCG-928-B08]|nr:alpha-2-macroglobulin [Desulfosarcina sp. OttesenSCG-928-B08]
MRKLAEILAVLTGRMTYTPAPWMRAIADFCRKQPGRFRVMAVVLACLALGAIGYALFRPVPPVQVAAHVTVPELPEETEAPRPRPLILSFGFEIPEPDGTTEADAPYANRSPDRFRWMTPVSVARLDLLHKTVDSIRLSPAMAGTWTWTDERTLVFEPESPWPAGTVFRVDLPRDIFTPETRLKQSHITFTTPAFAADIQSLRFYQDPVDLNVRKVVATAHFSHPVDEASLKSHVTLTFRPSGAGVDTPPQPVGFSVATDKTRHIAYITSEPLSIPEHSIPLRLSLLPGILPAAGGNAIDAPVSDTVTVPDRYSFLKVSSADSAIVTNGKGDPEQVITLDFTDAIARDQLLGKLSVHLLPQRNPHRKNTYWKSPREVTDADLSASDPVALKMVDNPRDTATTYHFVVDVPEDRYLYLKIAPGLESANTFIHRDFFDAVLSAPEYPRETRLAGDGSLVMGSGQQRLGVMTRGVPGIRATLARVLPGQLVHLITQTNGDIRDPYFNQYDFSEENICDISREVIPLNSPHPGKAVYTAVDLSAYRSAPHRSGPNRDYGLFLVSVEGWDPARDHSVYGTTDRRLIFVTDLGLVVKDNRDESHDLFVQRLSTGQPVAGATVQLLGKNGLPLFNLTTDENGHARIPETEDFENERQPSVYLVTTDTDTAFLPFDDNGQRVDVSRFNVGGLQAGSAGEDELNAFLFSDRGMYRPGETAHLGIMVKKGRLNPVTDIPLRVEIINPRHTKVMDQTVILPEKGFFETRLATTPTSATGRYQARLYLAGNHSQRGRLLGSTEFSVEEFIPDTMKISSTLAGARTRGWTSAKSLTATVTLTNLFGTPAQDRRVQAAVHIFPSRFFFPGYKDYHFSDPLRASDRAQIRLDEALPATETDEAGKAEFEIPLDRFQDGTYQLDFFVEGFDAAGGRGVKTGNSVLISPLSHLVGFKTNGDLGFIHSGSVQHVDWIAIGPDLSAISLDDLTLVRLDIQHISTLVKQPDGTFAYQTTDREKVVEKTPFAIAETGEKTALPTTDPGDYALEVYSADGTRLARLTYTVVGHGNLAGKLEKSAAPRIVLGKPDAKAGELIEMNITAPYTGAGLITIETDHVHAFKWFKTDTLSTLESIRLPEDLEGNAYVSVAFVRDPASREIFTSPFGAAVAPITIDRSRRVLDITLDTPEQVRPGETLAIGYKTGKPSRAVVFAVDEGILRVARYELPNPLDHFLKKRALQVETRQMLDLILPDYKILRELMASGGDAMKQALAAHLNPFARKADKPAVFWSGIVDADTETRTVSFPVPDTFSGNLVVMAVAVGDDAVGAVQTQTRVRGPFVLSPVVPLQAAPGDEFVATVGVSNLVEGAGPDAVVTVSAQSSPLLSVVGESTRTLSLGEGNEAPVQFTFRAGDTPGSGDITFTATCGTETAHRTAGLSVRPAMNYQTTFASGYAPRQSIAIPLSRNLFPQLAEQTVSASASPLVLVDALSAYLKHFPHGCTEQVVSQVFPLVGLSSLPAYADQRPDIERRFSALISLLRQRQVSGGGFCFWPGETSAAEFPSVYILHFLIDAREAGMAVPTDMMSRGTSFLRDLSAQKITDPAQTRTRAHAIYLLTRLGDTTTNMLVHLQDVLEENRKKTWRSSLTAVYMAATYRLLKMNSDADKLIGHYAFGGPRTPEMGDFDQPLTRDAQVLYLLSRHFPETAQRLGGETVRKMVEPIFRGETNTIGASYTILALSAYSRLQLPETGTESIAFAAETADGTRTVLESRPAPFPTAVFPHDSKKLDIKGSTPLFYLAVQSGFDRTLPDAPVRQGMEIFREYLDDDGDPVTTVVQGSELTVRLRIRSLEKAQITNVAIVDLLPGGFEVIRESVSRENYRQWINYTDIREDRVVFYGTVTKSVHEMTWRVKVTTPGQFVLPPASAESMYDRTVSAITEAGKMRVEEIEK